MHEERVLYEVKNLPVFQNRMYDSAVEARNCPRGDVRLVENMNTGLVYNSAFQPELVKYDSNYQNEQAVSGHFSKHLEMVSEIILDSLGSQNLVEVGCGKGAFLEMMQARGADISGFDPTYEGGNPRIARRNFEPDLGISANGLVLRHVLEHVQDPYSFLSSVCEANGGKGLIYIEVPCFDWICTHRAWFDIFYEHVNYFRLCDFSRLFGRVIECGRGFGDQYIYAVVDLASLKNPEYDASYQVEFPLDFQKTLYSEEIIEPEKAVVWGGSSKGVIFTLLKERIGQNIGHVVDINPAKQGKYIPATGLQVLSADGVDQYLVSDTIIYVMNSNYVDEIGAMTKNKYSLVTVDLR